MLNNESVVDRLALETSGGSHASGSLENHVLAKIEKHLRPMERTAETGCGKTTVLFSNYSREHLVFTIDDSANDNSSIGFYRSSSLSKLANIREIIGPTQLTLPKFDFPGQLDLVMIDGPHAYPFPDLEYYFFYPQIKNGGLLIVDDLHIATIGRMAQFIAEDEMFSLVDVIDTTAIFRRTSSPTFWPAGDGWEYQRYNIGRFPASVNLAKQE